MLETWENDTGDLRGPHRTAQGRQEEVLGQGQLARVMHDTSQPEVGEGKKK
jgi:hypothetical protein